MWKKAINNRKGGITLEAALFFPIFLIGILTVAYLMKFLYLQESVLYELCREGRVSIRQSVVADGTLAYPLVTSHRISGENYEMDHYHHRVFLYPLKTELTDKIAHYEGIYYQSIPFPLSLYEGVEGKETIRFRPFSGQHYRGEPAESEEMEAEETARMVWVFPRAGERYHKRECGVIAVFPSQDLLDSGIRSRYRPCSHCKPEGKENGSLIYRFPKAGEVYHQQFCSLVTRYVIEMELEEAEEAGYTPCRLCGGGSD